MAGRVSGRQCWEGQEMDRSLFLQGPGGHDVSLLFMFIIEFCSGGLRAVVTADLCSKGPAGLLWIMNWGRQAWEQGDQYMAAFAERGLDLGCI